MLYYIPILAVVGLFFGVLLVWSNKLIAKIEDAKKRKYIKIAIYVVVYFCLGCISAEVVEYFR